LRFLLSGGQGFDGKAAVPLLKPLPPAKKLLADKADDCIAFRDWLRGATPVIPNKINRCRPLPYDKRAYRHRNKIDRSAASPRRYPLRQKRPELPQRRLLDRRHLLLVKLSLDPG
jgi:hypothetical protein